MDMFVAVSAVVTMLASISAAIFAFRAAKGGHDEVAIVAFSDVVRKEHELARQSGEDHAQRLRQEIGDITRSAGKEIGGRIDGIGLKLDSDIAQMGRDAVLGRDALKTAIEQRLNEAAVVQNTFARELRDEVAANLKRQGEGLASHLLQIGEHQKERLENVSGELKTLTDKSERGQEALRQSVEHRLDSIREENAKKLEEMRQTVDEKLQSTLEQRLGDSFKRVVEQLERVHTGLGEMKNLAAGVGDLKKVLSNVSVRGTFGQNQLDALLVQFLSPEQFVKNAAVREGTLERVEFAVKLPEGVLLPIDAKFPKEDHDRLLAAAERGDADAVAEAAKALEDAVKREARKISEKYINPPVTTDFAILFLPTEGLYAEVLRRPGFFEQLQRDFHVTLTGPVTLTAFLNALQMGFRSLAIQKRSSEVWQVLGAVRAEFGKYNRVVEKLAKNLATASNSVEELSARTRIMGNKLKTVDTIDGQTAQSVLGLAANALPPPLDDEEDVVVAAQ